MKKRKKVPLIKISFSRESKKVKYFKRDDRGGIEERRKSHRR